MINWVGVDDEGENGGVHIRSLLCTEIFNYPAFKVSIHAIFTGPAAFKQPLSGSLHDELDYDSVAGQALKIIETLLEDSFTGAVRAVGADEGNRVRSVLSEFACCLVQLLAGQEVRLDVIQILNTCLTHNPDSLQPLFDSNLMDVLFMSLGSLHRHAPLADIYTNNGNFIHDWVFFDEVLQVRFCYPIIYTCNIQYYIHIFNFILTISIYPPSFH